MSECRSSGEAFDITCDPQLSPFSKPSSSSGCRQLLRKLTNFVGCSHCSKDINHWKGLRDCNLGDSCPFRNDQVSWLVLGSFQSLITCAGSSLRRTFFQTLKALSQTPDHCKILMYVVAYRRTLVMADARKCKMLMACIFN